MKAALRMAVGSVVLLAACQDLPEPSAPPATPQFARAAVQAAGMSDQAALAREVPEFGGLFLNDEGHPVAYVTDLSRVDDVRAHVARYVAAQGLSMDDLIVEERPYSFVQLSDAFERASHAAMPLAGTVFVDLDEVQNKIVVGVEHAGLARGVSNALAHAGLGGGEYEVIVSQPIRQAVTLRDRFDPTEAGIQLHFTQYVCTLGFNAYDGTERSFITNSHCTATQGGVENTAYYQSSSSVDATPIAFEVEDPLYVRGGVCPRGKKCRYSDSSRALYTNARASSNSIALTGGANSGSLIVAGGTNVVGKSYSVVAGTVVNKVGRTTGWTRASVSRTCVNTGVQGSQIMQFCQHWVTSSGPVIVGGGDSGSSVWVDAGGGAALVGLLWGGSSDNRTFIFSPIGQVEQELGTLIVN